MFFYSLATLILRLRQGEAANLLLALVGSFELYIHTVKQQDVAVQWQD